MIIHIRDFGKIKSAEIDFTDFTILVGENNTGKTYLMELIYGLLSFFCDSEFSYFLLNYSGLEISHSTIIRTDDTAFYSRLNDDINNLLDKYKERIVKNTFHSDEISIGSLAIEFNASGKDFSVHKDGDIEMNDRKVRQFVIRKDGEDIFKFGFDAEIDSEVVSQTVREQLLKAVVFEALGVKTNSYINIGDNMPFIYLPASRSGMVMLYANYLADTDKSVYTNGRIDIQESGTRHVENEYGLTEPVYGFLQSLLKYKTGVLHTERNSDLISFVDRNIIEGRFEKAGNTMRYIPSKKRKSLPIYLSSSLATEMAPIYQILSGVNSFNTIFYDEIETCQHPTKQLQLARLLVRMVNKGYRIMVSTHSDTMAAAINNLVLLSRKSNRKALLKKLDYEERDILKTTNVKAYQFISENGESRVIELDGYFNSGVGFDFSIFNRSNDKIYDDAVILAGEDE